MNPKRVYWVTCILMLLAVSAGATTIILPTDEQLVAKASVIVDGTVVSSTPVERDGRIVTETVVSVARAIRGEVSGTITVREIGGELGDRITKIYGTPEFTEGERVLLFLDPHPAGGYRTIDLFVGKFREGTTTNGQRLWLRNADQEVNLLDQNLEPIHATNVQRDAAAFEAFVYDRLAGRPGQKNYGVENPVLESDVAGDSGARRFTSQFTLISEPTVYRWGRFDSGQTAQWYSSGSQTSYADGGVSELRTAMSAWTGYSSANINYSYVGSRGGSLGGLDSPNGINEVLFNDPLNEIAGSFTGSGTVGVGGFNGVSSATNWTAPFAADATHNGGTFRAWNITEGNLTIQNGVTTGSGISSSRLAEIISHEFGHTLGFGHSADSTALMYYMVTGRGPSLRTDDQLAARWLYPNGSQPPPEPTVPAAPSSLVATVSGSNLDLRWNDNADDETSQGVWLSVGGGSFSRVATLGANIESTRLSGLASGSYRVYIIASNGAGNSSPSNTASATIADAPVAAFSFSPSSGTAGITSFTFYDESQGSVTSRSWTFGDGSSSTASTPSHVYASAGTYTVTLRVSNAAGTSQTSRNVSVSAQQVALSAAFTFSPSNPTTATTVYFDDDSAGSPTSWSWNFGDGTTSTAASPSKIFSNAGTYSVRLTVYRSGASSTTTRSVTVVSSAPAEPAVSAAFDFTPSSPVPGTDVQFYDRSSGSPTSWTWSFGDGGTSNAKNPSHRYGSAGTFTVRLTVSNASSSSSISRTVRVASVESYRSLVSGAAQTDGAGGTVWRTELTLLNAGSQSANITMVFLPSAGGGIRTREVYLAPRQSTTYDNALLDLFGMSSGAGAIAIDATSASTTPQLRVTSRTFTTGVNGTYGQSVPDIEPSKLGQTQYVTGMQSNGRFRTNVGLVNRASFSVPVTLTLYNSTGAALAAKSLTVPANSFQQWPVTEVFPQIAGAAYDVLSMRASSGADGVINLFASVVDNVSQDPVYVKGVPLTSGSDLTIAGVGRTAGANGTYWRSDVTLYNPTGSRLYLTLQFDGSSKSLAISSGDTVVLADVLSQFGRSSGNGALRVSWSGSTGPVVTSRTYTTTVTGSTYGQAVDPIESFGNSGFVPGLHNDSNFRSNVGFVNGGNETESFTAILLSEYGSEVSRKQVTLTPGAQMQSAVTQLFPGIGYGTYTLQLAGDANANLFAFGSVIDNRSGDPIFIAGR